MAPQSVRTVDVAGQDTIVAATASASTIADLVTTVPQTWRSSASSLLTTKYRVAGKLCNVQNTLAQYQRHDSERSFPGSITNSVKEPTLQFSKEFLGTATGALVKSTFADEILTARKALLASATKRKQEELTALQALTAFDVVAWRKMVADVADRAAQTYGVQVQGDITSDVPPVWSKGAPDTAVSDCRILWTKGHVWHYRAIALARSISDRSLLDKTKTLSLKKETDVRMRDADTELSTRQVVRDELDSRLKAFESRLAQTMRNGKKSGSPPKKKKAGSNPNRVTKGPNKGNGKGRKR